MRRIIIAVVCSCPTFFGLSQSAGPDREPQAVSALQRTAATLGAHPGVIRNALVEGEVIDLEGGTSPVPFVVLAEAKRLRWTFLRPQGELVMVVGEFSGTRVDNGRASGMGLNALSGLGTEMLPPLGVMEWLGSGRFAAALAEEDAGTGPRVRSVTVGAQTERGSATRGECERIEVGADGGDAIDPIARQARRLSRRLELCLRPSDGLPTSLRYYLHPGDFRIDIPAELHFADWDEVDGTWWPASITRLIGGRPSAEFRLTSVTLNVPATEDDFAP